MKTKKQNGFSLIELLTALTIMGILSAVSWSLYNLQIAKSYRQDCISGLTGAIQALEEWHNTIGVYNVAGMNNYKAAVNNANLQQCQQRGYQTGANPFLTCNNNCRITVTIPDTRANAPADSYLLTATRFYSASTPDDNKDSECNVFTVNDLGTKTALDLTAAISTQKCWLAN